MMKTKLTLFVAVLAFCLQQGYSQDKVDLKKGLVAYYPFNGNSLDESGNGNHGGVNGARFAPDRNGRSDKAYSFDGNSRIHGSSIKGLDNVHTTSCWVRIPKQEDIRVSYIVSLGGGAESNNNWIEIQTGPVVRVGTSSGQLIDSKWRVTSGKWFQITTTFNGVSRSLYINGSMDGKPREMGSAKVEGFHVGGSSRWGFKGSIDDVRIYNRALSAEEVKALYDLEKPKTK